MRLSDNEKRDGIKYIQQGKPLPEKYRFLLFDDDREGAHKTMTGWCVLGHQI